MMATIGIDLHANASLFTEPRSIALFENLIRTYTNEGETVLDNCIGAGTTALACKNTNRNFIGMEQEQKYVDIANERLNEPILQTSLFSV